MQKYVISILVKNRTGVLNRVSSLFSRRGYNIHSICSGVTTNNELSRLTVVVDGDKYILEQITKQLNKLVEVIEVERLNISNSVQRDLVLIKIKNQNLNNEFNEICDFYKTKIVEKSDDFIALELCGNYELTSKFLEDMKNFEVIDFVQTGVIALKTK